MEKDKTCIDVISELLTQLTEIAEVKFVSFNDYDIIQNRIDDNIEIKQIINNALQIRSDLNLPFWDSFNVSIFNKKISSFDFFEQVKFHNSANNIIKIESNRLNKFFEEINFNNYLTINSKVRLKSGELKHIPLLDFHIPVSDENQRICIEVIKALNLRGHLLVSGKSYHFYGNQLVDESSLIDLLSFSLLFSPIIDRAWIAHQLIERSSCLRISNKYSKLPYVVAVI